MSKLKAYKSSYFVFAIFIMVYCVIRAIYVGMVHDEVTTFYHFILPVDFIPYQTKIWDANNHILNSLLGVISSTFFGYSPLALRLPNLLSLVLYLFYTYKLSLVIKDFFVKYALVAGLLFSHFFVEYFSLCRGYGLSMGFLMGGLYYVHCYYSTSKLKPFVLSLVFLLLASLANLTLINTFILTLLALITHLFFNRKAITNKLFYFLPIFLIGVIPIFLLAIYGFELKERGLLYYGGLSGFWSMTIETLLPYFVGETVVSGVVLVLLFIGLIAVLVVFNLPKRKISSFLTSCNLFGFLLIGNWLATLFLGYVLGTNFPEDRTGLYFYPLFILALVFAADRLLELFPNKKFYLFVLPLFYFPIHFIFTANLSHHSFWFFERIPDSFYSKIEEANKGREEPFTLGGYFSDQSVWAFYNDEYTNSTVVQSFDFQTNIADYAIYRNSRNQVIPDNYEVVEYDEISEKSLLKRKQLLSRKVIHTTDVLQKKMGSDEFFELYKTDLLDRYVGKNIYVLFEFEMDVKNGKTTPINLVLAVDNKEEEKNIYEPFYIHWHQKKSFNNQIKYGIYSPKIEEGSTSMVVYLWNIYKEEYSVKNASVSIYELQEEPNL